MDVPLVSPPSAGAASITPLTSATALAIEQAQNAALLAASQTTVDISPLARFLSATALFQKRTLELQIAAGSPITAQDQVAGFDAIVLSAQALAVAFNELPGGDTGLPSGTFSGQSFAALFARQFGAETVPAGEGGDAARASLAAIGLTFVPGATPEAGEELQVDLPALQAAFESDPVGTTTVLSNTANSFSELAGIPPEAEANAQALPSIAPAEQELTALPSPEDAFLRALLSENATVIAAPADETEALAPPLAAPTDAVELQALVDTAPVAPPSNPLTIDQDVEAEVTQALAEQAALAASAPSAVDEEIAPPLAAQARELTPAQTITPPAAPQVNSVTVEQEAEAAADKALAALATRNAAAASEERTERLAVEVRNALSAADEARELDKDNLERAQINAQEQRRQQQAVPPEKPALATPVALPATVTTVEPVRRIPPAEEPVVVARPLPVPAPLDRLAPAARDPAVAAAIAAYSLNTGAFSALNVRPEIAAPRVKIVPAVSTVAKVAAIDTDSATKGGAKEFR
ncbi:MAG: hypothetical protein V4631_23065 [Pseudomonadota bacterium]